MSVPLYEINSAGQEKNGIAHEKYAFFCLLARMEIVFLFVEKLVRVFYPVCSILFSETIFIQIIR